MGPPVPCEISLFALAVLTLAGGAILLLLFRPLLASRAARAALLGALAALATAHGLWAYADGVLGYYGMIASCVGVIVLGFAVASLLPAALVQRALRRLLVPRAAPAGEGLMSRRALVQAATAAIPVASVVTALRGFAAGRADVEAPVVLLPSPTLPPALDGLTLLQLSDLHLGIARDLGDLDRFLARVAAGPIRPDLIVLTGDVADDLGQLAPALRLVAGFGARLGAVACLGNHEYLRQIELARPIYDRSPVPLLVDAGLVLRDPARGGARIYVAGIDDPVSVEDDVRPTLRRSVDRAARDAPSDALRVLLAHRPEAFVPASEASFDLTLSGHTHGGQIGFNGKSAFEPLWPDGYLWGRYARGGALLYTTSGFGNWFPFRVGCPAEAPLLRLRYAPSQTG
jgi:predicted MPP superfamily phosphohydrolase